MARGRLFVEGGSYRWGESGRGRSVCLYRMESLAVRRRCLPRWTVSYFRSRDNEISDFDLRGRRSLRFGFSKLQSKVVDGLALDVIFGITIRPLASHTITYTKGSLIYQNPTMSSKTKKTDPSSRAKSTSTLNSAPVQTQPLPPHPSLSSFNSTRTRFAAVVSAGLAGGQRLRCWDTVRGGIVREWDLPLDTKGEKRGVRSVVWATLRGSAGEAAGAGDMEVEDGSSKKKRKRKSAGGLTSESGVASSSTTADQVECVVIVQASTLFYYSPEQSGVKPIKTISLGTTPCAILPLTNAEESRILTVSNSTIEVIDPNSGSVNLSTPLPDGFISSTNSSLALSLLDSDHTTLNTLEIVIASTQMTILTLPLPLSTASKSKIEFTRPQSISLEPVRSVASIPRLSSGTTTRKFVTVEEDSRVATVWAVSEGGEGSENTQVETIGTVPTDTSEPIHTLSIRPSSSDSSSAPVEMFLTSLSGQTFIYSIEEGSFNPPNAAVEENPNALVSSSKKRRSTHKKSAPVVTLKPISTVVLVVGGTSGSTSVGKEEVGLRMVGCTSYPGAKMAEEEEGEILVGWMAGPGRIVWDQAVSPESFMRVVLNWKGV